MLEAAHTKSTQIHSFDEAPSPENEPVILSQLEDEIEVKAQRVLTGLSQQQGLDVVPFQDTRRISPDIATHAKVWNEEQLLKLGKLTMLIS